CSRCLQRFAVRQVCSWSFYPFAFVLDALSRYSFQQMIDLKKSNYLAAAGRQQLRKLLEALPTEVSQLPAVGLLYGLIEPGEQLEPFLADAGKNHAAVFSIPGAQDPASFFEPVEQAGNVRIARDHAAADLSTGEAFRGSAQDSQNVVLGSRQVFALDYLGWSA